MSPFTYFMFRRKMYAPEIGTYYSHDIVVYARFMDGPVAILRDVTPDGDLAFCMVKAFNRFGLSPLHLKDVVLDMLV